MDEWTFGQMCERTACDYNCMRCPLMARYQRELLGYDDEDEDDEYEDNCED